MYGATFRYRDILAFPDLQRVMFSPNRFSLEPSLNHGC
jgi:hypothetical protein